MAAKVETRDHGLSTVGTVLFAGLAAVAVAMLFTNWVVIDVRTDGLSAHRVVVPVPLNLLRVPLRLADRSRAEAELVADLKGEEREILDALQQLEAAPAGSYVVVGRGHCPVRLGREGDKLVLKAHGNGGMVRATVPFAAASRALRLCERGHLHALDALDLLAAGRGELLKVDAKNAVIRITVR